MLAQCWRNVSAPLSGHILLAALFAALLRHSCGTLAAVTNSSKTVKSQPVCLLVIENQAIHQNKLTIKNHFASIRVSEGLSDVQYRVWCPVSTRQMHGRSETLPLILFVAVNRVTCCICRIQQLKRPFRCPFITWQGGWRALHLCEAIHWRAKTHRGSARISPSIRRWYNSINLSCTQL